jgi:hypothetical protein
MVANSGGTASHTERDERGKKYIGTIYFERQTIKTDQIVGGRVPP